MCPFLKCNIGQLTIIQFTQRCTLKTPVYLTHWQKSNISALSAVPCTFSSFVNHCIKAFLNRRGHFIGACLHLRSSGVLSSISVRGRWHRACSLSKSADAGVECELLLTEPLGEMQGGSAPSWGMTPRIMQRNWPTLRSRVPGPSRRAGGGQSQSFTTSAGPRTTLPLRGAEAGSHLCDCWLPVEHHLCYHRQRHTLPLGTWEVEDVVTGTPVITAAHTPDTPVPLLDRRNGRHVDPQLSLPCLNSVCSRCVKPHAGSADMAVSFLASAVQDGLPQGGWMEVSRPCCGVSHPVCICMQFAPAGKCVIYFVTFSFFLIN